MIKNIVFDFGKVLVDYNFDLFLSTIFPNRPEEMKEFEALTCSKEYVDRCDKGDMSFKEIIEETQQLYPHWKEELQEFHDRQIECITGEVPGMRELIMELKSMGYGIYGLTNWSETVYKVIEKYSILQLMDARIVSSEERLIKPERAIYDRLCQKFGLNASECLFTDDKPANVEGAIAAGMYALLFKNAATFRKELFALLGANK